MSQIAQLFKRLVATVHVAVMLYMGGAIVAAGASVGWHAFLPASPDVVTTPSSATQRDEWAE